SEEHTSELQSLTNLVCRLLLEKKMPAFLLDGLKGRRSAHGRAAFPKAAEPVGWSRVAELSLTLRRSGRPSRGRPAPRFARGCLQGAPLPCCIQRRHRWRARAGGTDSSPGEARLAVLLRCGPRQCPPAGLPARWPFSFSIRAPPPTSFLFPRRPLFR